MKKRQLLIFGSGTLGEIAAYYFDRDSDYEVIAIVDLPNFVREDHSIQGRPIIEWGKAREAYSPRDVHVFVAVGYRGTNSIREARYREVKEAGFTCASYVSSRASVFTEGIGDNCFILEGNVLQPFSIVGNNVTMWSGNHLGHHSVIEDNVFIASQVVISGKCRIGANSFLGVNSCLHDGIHVGAKSVIGAGAIVTESCPDRSVFVPSKLTPRIIDRDII